MNLPGAVVYVGRIVPEKNLARYIIRASFSQERIQYLDQEGKVVYTAKDGRTSKSFPVLEWMANLCPHIPDRANIW